MGVGEAKGDLRLFVLPAVEAISADSPPRRLYLALSLGYYGDAVGLELARSSSMVSEAVRHAAGSFTAAEINSVEGYESLRAEILTLVNRMLRSGRVDRVLIRSVSVR
jgi:flagellar basal body-associated protein FliL